MKKLLTLAITSVAIFAMAAVAVAQPAEPGDLGVYFDPGATMTSATLTAFVPFNVYIISTDVPAGQEGYEFTLNADPGVTFTVETFNPPGSSDFGVDGGATIKNYLVGTGGQCYGDGTTEILVEWQALVFASLPDMLFCLEAATPSSFSPAVPGYLACNSPGDLRPYGAAYEGCAVANPVTVPVPVAIEESTWGAVKAQF